MRLPVVFAALAAVLAAGPTSAQYTLYYGNFHSHCNLSDDATGPLSGPPDEAFQYARDVAGIDVLALTDHTHYLSASDYVLLQSEADTWTTNGTFVAIAGQEHGSLSTSATGAFGHINVWEALVRIDQGLFRYDLPGTYSWIAANIDGETGAPLVGSFNHPYSGSGQGIWAQFKSFEWDSAGDAGIELTEMVNGKRSSSYEDQYIDALQKGWHVGVLGNQDNHEGSWGDQPNNIGNIPLTGVWATALTKADILEALAARRTFAMEVSPATDRIQLEFTADGNWMGSEYTTAADSVHFQVVASAGTNLSTIQLFRNGVFLKSTGVSGASTTWDVYDTPGPGDFWYFVKVNQADGDRAWSSPIWIESTSTFSVPLAAVAQDDGNGYPTLWFQTVTVQGFVTAETDTFSTVDNVIYLQDGEAGVLVHQVGQQSPEVAAGDNLLVMGTVDTFQGQTFLASPSITVLGQGGDAPEPVVITTNDLATTGETWENMLVELRNVAIVGGTWPTPGNDGSVTIDDGSGPATLMIDRDTSLDDVGAPVEPTFWLRGVVVQRDLSPPYTCCWAVLPRYASDVFQPSGVDVVELPSHHATERTLLHPGEPNPLRSRTRFRFDLAGARGQSVHLDVYDVSGRRVRTLVDGQLDPGEYEATWDGRSASGQRVSAGVYFVRLRTPDAESGRKVVVLD